jgi:hypothetical protein
VSPDRVQVEGVRSGFSQGPLAPERNDDLRDIADALHDLCQPLTALHCRLEIGELNGTPDGYHEAVTEGLRECSRLLRGVGQMRELVRQALERK